MDNQSAQSVIAALSAPFDDSQVFHRVDERTGKNLSYVPAANIYRRLNEAAPGWEFKIVNSSMQKIETRRGPLLVAVVTGEMTVPGVGTRMGMGTAPIYAPDDFKGATTDALKRCSSLFGVALYLYGGDDAPQQQGYQQPPQQLNRPDQGSYPNQQQQAPQQQSQPQQQGYGNQQPQQQRQNYQQGGGGGGYDNSQPVQYDPNHDSGEMRTDPQSRKLGFELGDKGMGITEASNQSGIPVAGDSVDTITKKQATALIDWLTRQESKLNRQPQGGGGGGWSGQQQNQGYGGDDQDINQVPF